MNCNVTINVEATTYNSLLLSIRELEQLERVVGVDMINYSLNGKICLRADSTTTVPANIQVTTFYYVGEE